MRHQQVQEIVLALVLHYNRVNGTVQAQFRVFGAYRRDAVQQLCPEEGDGQATRLALIFQFIPGAALVLCRPLDSQPAFLERQRDHVRSAEHNGAHTPQGVKQVRLLDGNRVLPFARNDVVVGWKLRTNEQRNNLRIPRGKQALVFGHHDAHA